jgi:hypothetical protein
MNKRSRTSLDAISGCSEQFPVVTSLTALMSESVPHSWKDVENKEEVGSDVLHMYNELMYDELKGFPNVKSLSQAHLEHEAICNEYVRVNYIYHPQQTILDYINSISVKSKNRTIDPQILLALMERKLTLPILLGELFSLQNLYDFGY